MRVSEPVVMVTMNTRASLVQTSALANGYDYGHIS